MSDPVPVPQRRTPRRAEPMQPDQPGRGDERDDAAGSTEPSDRESADKLRKQSEDAVDNVSTGYD